MKRLKFIFAERKKTARLAAGITGFFVLLLASAAFGDVVDDGLPADAPQAVKKSAREAIRSGLGQDGVVGLTRAMLQQRFDAQQIQQAHALMVGAQNSGLPVDPLMNKAFEGMAKGVDPSLIVGAMERVRSRDFLAYRHAAALSGNKSRAANLGRALSAAMAAGFSKGDAERITQMLRQQAQTLPSDQAYSLALECFYTARDVSRLGVPSQAVTNMLTNALTKGFSHQDIRAMRSAFMAQAQHSEPQNLAHSYANAIQEGRGFQEGPGGAGTGSGMDAGESGTDRGGSGSSGGSAGGGSAGSGGGSGSGSGGSGGSGPDGGKK